MTVQRAGRLAGTARLALSAVAVVLAILLGAYALSLATAKVERRQYRTVIGQAVDSGALTRRHRLPLGSGEPLAIHNFNDCLILSMLILPQDANAFLRALTPRVPSDDTAWSGSAEPGYPAYVQCRDLAAAMSRAEEIPTAAYHRYLHGDWILAKTLLAVMPLAMATNAMAGALMTVLLALTATALCRVLVGGETPRDRAYLILAVGLTVFWALPIFAWSLSFAPSDLVIASFLFVFYLKPPSSLAERHYVMLMAAFGTLTALFEFLTGASPSGLMALIAVVAFDSPGTGREVLRRLVLGTVAFAGAIALSFMIKMTVVAAIFGVSELGLFGRQIGAHMSAGGWDVAPQNLERLSRLGLSVESIRQSAFVSYVYALSKIVYFSRQMAFGSLALGAALTVILPLLLVVLNMVRLRRCRAAVPRLRIKLVLLACLVMPVWYLLFMHHTIVHAHFMFRPMVWPLTLLLASLAWPAPSVPHAGRSEGLDTS